VRRAVGGAQPRPAGPAFGRSPRRPRARSRHGSRAPTATTRSTSAGAGGCPPG
jgi:hypothetical protein